MKQLHVCASDEFTVVSYCAEDSGVTLRSAATLPQPHWPNGHWSVEVSLFLNELLDNGYVHKPRGGTLGTYAAYLAPLVRFCAAQRLKGGFLALTDQDFTKAVEALYQSKTKRKGVETATCNRTTIRAMVGVWLDFLSYLAVAFADHSFIGERGRIRAKKVRASAPAGRGIQAGETWSHHALGPSDPYNRRMPLRDEQLRQLRVAAMETSANSFLQRRRLTMLDVFDMLGLRRIEASLLRVSDVKSAILAAKSATMDRLFDAAADDLRRHACFVSFRMRKQPDGEEERCRRVPVSPVSLQFLKEFLTLRRQMLKDASLKESDTDGSFFVNPSTGRAYAPNFFTYEFWALAKAAGITEPCSPHMARARYFTRELVRLILAHDLETKDDFRRALISSDAFLQQVMEISGHQDPESLKLYINLAFAEVAEFAKTLSRVEAQRALDSVEAANNRYVLSVSSGVDPAVAGAELSRVLMEVRVGKA